MQFLFDNLTATVIAMTVLLILASMQMRATRQQVAQTSQDIVQRQAGQLTTWLEKDLGQIGKNMSDDETAFEEPVDSGQKWLTEKFVFEHEEIDSTGTVDTVRVRYLIESTGSSREIDMGGTTKSVELYQLTREKKVVGETGWQAKGGSIPALEYFDVDLLDRNAEPVSDPVSNEDDVRSVRVRFSLVAPYQNEELAVPVSRTNVVIARYPLGDS
ncbi:MAG: hypothetical protein BRD41_03355 [Bacteroidetes bacterium QS_1_63_11]|nr:MAG: hypothetical protein BRD41_03355 [Bacteroidetes bacterium QS_1_63_11]